MPIKIQLSSNCCMAKPFRRSQWNPDKRGTHDPAILMLRYRTLTLLSPFPSMFRESRQRKTCLGVKSLGLRRARKRQAKKKPELAPAFRRYAYPQRHAEWTLLLNL